MTVYAGLKALHLLCAVLWVGGMFFAYVVLRPSMAAIEAPQRMLLHTRVFKKFFLVVWHAMPLIIITGFAMLGLSGGMAGAPWQVHTMLGLGLLMAAIFLAIVFGPYRQFRRTRTATDGFQPGQHPQTDWSKLGAWADHGDRGGPAVTLPDMRWLHDRPASRQRRSCQSASVITPCSADTAGAPAKAWSIPAPGW